MSVSRRRGVYGTTIPYVTGGGSPARHGGSADEPSSSATSTGPPPPPTGVIRLDGTAGGVYQSSSQWLSYHDRLEIQNRQMLRPPPAAAMQSTSTRVRDLRINCFLCRRGVRSFDAGKQGTGLYVELLRQIATQLGHVTYEAVTDSARNFYQVRRDIAFLILVLLYDRLAYQTEIDLFYQEQMVPVFARAGVELPPFEYEAVFEHLSTLEHSKNPGLMIVQEITDTKREMREMQVWRDSIWRPTRAISRALYGPTPGVDSSPQDHVRKPGEAPCLKTMAEIRKHRLSLFPIYRAGADLSKLYGYEAIDGEPAPDTVQHLAPAVHAVSHLQGDMMPGHLDWLIQNEAQALSAAALDHSVEEEDNG